MTGVSTVPAAAPDEVGSALLEAASALLAEHGAAALTVRRIAETAGVSTMNVYSRFGGKHGVVDQLFLRGFALLATAMDAAPVTDDPIADLRACGQAYRQFALDHPTLYSVMFERAVPDYDPSPVAAASGLAALQLLAARIQRAVDGGRLRSGDPMHLAAIVWSTCHGAVSLERKGAEQLGIDWPRVYGDACENTIRGLAT